MDSVGTTRTTKRTMLGALLAVGVSLSLVAPVFAAVIMDQTKTVGTGWSGRSSNLGCSGMGNCTSDWSHRQLICGKTSSARIRWDKPFQPDSTVRSDNNFTSCNVARGWNITQEALNSQNYFYEGLVTTGTGSIRYVVQQ